MNGFDCDSKCDHLTSATWSNRWKERANQMAVLMGWAHPPNDSLQHDLKLYAWQMQGSAGFFELSSPEISRRYYSCWQSGHLWSIVMHFCMKSKWIVNWFPKCPRDPPTCFLTVHLQTDCDVHGASNIHSSADVFPSILWDSFFNVQTAVAPQKDPCIGLNLGRKKHYWHHTGALR